MFLDRNGEPPGELNESDDEPVYNIRRSKREVRSGAECPYLDTISRQVLVMVREKRIFPESALRTALNTKAYKHTGATCMLSLECFLQIPLMKAPMFKI